jgi:hypothetical protein
MTRLAADALIETIDGPMEIVKLIGKTIPVLTRFPAGELGFRMMSQVREIAPEAPLVRLRNADHQVVIVGADHVFVDSAGREVRAAEVTAGMGLEAGWTYPGGYSIPDADEYSSAVRGRDWSTPVLVLAREDAGHGPVYGATVAGTKSFFLTFGARCRAQV